MAEALQREFAVDRCLDLRKDVAATVARFAAAGLLTEGKDRASTSLPIRRTDSISE
jgi:hypothetical protein